MPVLMIYLELSLEKILEGTTMDGLKVENKQDLPVKWVDTLESMTQEDDNELASQDIPGCAKIAI